MVFKKQALLFCLILGSLAWLLFYTLFTQSATDLAEYHALFERKEVKKEASSKQERLYTEKTVLLSEGGKRKRGELKSPASLLIFQQSPEGNALFEEMDGVSLLFQEGFDSEGQTVVSLEAKKALYSYQEQALKAEDVQISRYKLKGFDFPESFSTAPFFIGKADSVTVNLGSEIPEMTAHGLKAEIKE